MNVLFSDEGKETLLSAGSLDPGTSMNVFAFVVEILLASYCSATLRWQKGNHRNWEEGFLKYSFGGTLRCHDTRIKF
jgi:hypothetical protein